jgi:hypothetical protein
MTNVPAGINTNFIPNALVNSAANRPAGFGYSLVVSAFFHEKDPHANSQAIIQVTTVKNLILAFIALFP